MKVVEIAKMLQIGRTTVYRYLQQGLLQGTDAGSLQLFLDSCEGDECLVGDHFIAPSKLAAKLNVSISTVYRWFDEGRLEGKKFSAGKVSCVRIKQLRGMDAPK